MAEMGNFTQQIWKQIRPRKMYLTAEDLKKVGETSVSLNIKDGKGNPQKLKVTFRDVMDWESGTPHIDNPIQKALDKVHTLANK